MASYANVISASKKARTLVFDGFTIFAGSLFIALMAQFSFYIGGSPVPVTLQTFAIFMLAGMLGGKRASLAVIAYLVEGAAGLPFFSEAGLGLTKLAGPTGGYLAGFIPAAFVAGYLLERGWKEKYSLSFLAMILACFLIYFFGASWLSVYVGKSQAFALGVTPFVIGEMIKISAAAFLIPSGCRILNYLK